jgi:hypothetical protein
LDEREARVLDNFSGKVRPASSLEEAKTQLPMAKRPREAPSSFSSSSDEDGWGVGRRKSEAAASVYLIDGVTPGLDPRGGLDDVQWDTLEKRHQLRLRREDATQVEDEEAEARPGRVRMHLARLPALRYGAWDMTAEERAALEAERAGLAAEAARRSERAQAAALEEERAEALAAKAAEFVREVEAQRNDPARPETLILGGAHLKRLEALDPERRALLEDGRLRRLVAPTSTTTADDPYHAPDGKRRSGESSREMFVYDSATRRGEMRSAFRRVASRTCCAR